MIETILAVGGVIAAGKAAYDSYQTASAILKGGTRGERIADQTLLELQDMNQSIERLSDNILYAPDLKMLHDVNAYQKEQKFRNIREQLDPIQQQIGGEILSSSIIITPQKMQQALKGNPWGVLINITPIKYAKEPNESGFVPISFHHGHEWYIGWQKKGALPSLFDCEYQDLDQLFSQQKINNQEDKNHYNVAITSLDHLDKRIDDLSKEEYNEIKMKGVFKDIDNMLSDLEGVPGFDVKAVYDAAENIKANK